MRPSILPWPKIIAVFVAGLGVSGAFSASGVAYASGAYGSASWVTFDWRVIAISTVLLLIAYPLATGREWARRTLLVTVVVVGTALILYYAVCVVASISSTDLTPEQIKVVRLSKRFEDASTLLLVLTSLVFGVSFLSHPDVVATFQHSPNAPEKT